MKIHDTKRLLMSFFFATNAPGRSDFNRVADHRLGFGDFFFCFAFTIISSPFLPPPFPFLTKVMVYEHQNDPNSKITSFLLYSLT